MEKRRGNIRCEIRSKDGSWLSHKLSREGSVSTYVSEVESNESLRARKIGKIRRITLEKEKKDRKENVVIKGMNIEERIIHWAEKLIEEKLKIVIKVKKVKVSGKVIIARLESGEIKMEVYEIRVN